jgi:hypothetical protein
MAAVPHDADGVTAAATAFAAELALRPDAAPKSP